jgi:hypothetical protein
LELENSDAGLNGYDIGRTRCIGTFAGDAVTKHGSAHEPTIFELRPSKLKYSPIEFA